jgi:hypothetical protein
MILWTELSGLNEFKSDSGWRTAWQTVDIFTVKYETLLHEISNILQEVTDQLSEYLPDGVTTFAKNMTMAITRTHGNWNEETEVYSRHTSSYYRILTMVYNFQKYWVFGLYPSSWY